MGCHLQQIAKWSEQLELYLGIHERKLRFFTREGQLVPTLEEAVIAEQQRANQEQQRADQAEALLTRYRERFGEFLED
jgi:hypothetical protein